MISWNVRATCEEARLHYYDCLEDPGMVDVPQGIRDHLKACPYCRQEIERLDRILNNDTQTEQESNGRAAMINSLLNLHFRYVESAVTCSEAKLFLASMADPEIELRVPTPITAHIDQCAQCADDLKTLKGLGLSNEQLRRLNQFFSDLLTKDTDECHADDDIIKAVAELRFADIEGAILKHVCKCDHCRSRVMEDRRQKSVALEPRGDGKLCHTVHGRDLFDYVFPYGVNPLSDEYYKFRQTLVEHIRQCPNCLKRMLDIGRRIFVIGERADSGVSTCFHIKTDKARGTSAQDNPYEGYPVYIEVSRSSAKLDVSDSGPEAAKGIVTKTGYQQRSIGLKWSRIAAAIALVFGLSVVFWPHRAGAGFFDKVYQATLAAPVVHIEMIEPLSGVMLQECWVLSEENRVIIAKKNEIADLDLDGNKLTTLDPQSGQLTTTALEEDMRRDMEQQVRTLFSLMPYGFQSLSAEVSDQTLDRDGFGQTGDVYEVEWTDGTGDTEMRRQWIAHVDPTSQRLRKVRWYTEDPFTGALAESRRYYINYPEPGRVEHLLEQLQLLPHQP